MSFDRSIQILFALIAAFALVTLARALATGRLGYGPAALARASDPGRYWYSFVLLAGLAAAAPAVALDSPFASAAVQLLIALGLAFHPWRWLRDGEAGWEQAAFRRSEEPLQFWLLVGGSALLVLAAIAVAAASAAIALATP